MSVQIAADMQSMFTWSVWSLTLCYSKKFVWKCSIVSTVNILIDCKWSTVLLPTQTKQAILKPHTCESIQYLAQGHVWLLSQGKAPVPGLSTEKCNLLYVTLPASSSVVNTACLVYGNVGHLFVVLLGVRPQVEVYDCGVDVTCLSLSLLHQLVKLLFDQLHRPNRTTSDLNLSPVPWTQQLAWNKWEANAQHTELLTYHTIF